MFDFNHKVAIVTGGASGIGLETAKELLKNGVKGVVLADSNVHAGKIAADRLGDEYERERVFFVETDVSNKQSFEDAFKFTLTKFGNIDILVNNAGIPDEVNYEKLVAVNLTGIIHGTVLAHENYILNHKSGPEGVIINTASTAGCHVSPVCHFVYGTPIYGATKSGVISLTIGLGNTLHYEKSKIKVLAIAPGMTLTNIGSHFKPRSAFHAEIMMKETQKGVVQNYKRRTKNI
ncbi:hypothetical protein WA026_005850 [Henosepilachna vigintioctopunctata]|uniref:Uncharacterized protein n=1 Tax=Henosepilachna vigintioctopunctata TaxID=420089 RepID=A0AAW1TXP7_9CUCU